MTRYTIDIKSGQYERTHGPFRSIEDVAKHLQDLEVEITASQIVEDGLVGVPYREDDGGMLYRIVEGTLGDRLLNACETLGIDPLMPGVRTTEGYTIVWPAYDGDDVAVSWGRRVDKYGYINREYIGSPDLDHAPTLDLLAGMAAKVWAAVFEHDPDWCQLEEGYRCHSLILCALFVTGRYPPGEAIVRAFEVLAEHKKKGV